MMLANTKMYVRCYYLSDCRMHTILLVVECSLFLLFVIAIGCDQVGIFVHSTCRPSGYLFNLLWFKNNFD